MQNKIVAPMTVLYAVQELTIPEVSIYADKYGTEIMAEVEKYGLRIAGPWVFIAHHLPKNGKTRYKAEFCLPIEKGETYAGDRFPVKTLNRFPCACAEYHGKLRSLFTQGYQPLVREMVAEKMNFTGESREVYHAWHGPNSPENRIEIQFGIG